MEPLGRAYPRTPEHRSLRRLRRTLGGTIMFRDDQQLARACRALLATVHLERLWNERGPTSEASELLEAEPAEALCFLVMASRYGADAVDDWLVEHARGGTGA